MCSARLPLGALRTRRLIGRTKEREAIRTAIEAEGQLRVLHIIGEGGMGKTRLLEAIPEEILPECNNKNRCQWGGFFDLYHVDIHTNSGIEEAIIKALNPKGFRAYRSRRREYEKLRRAGGDPSRLEQLRGELADLFVEGFNEITSPTQKLYEASTPTRVILCLDTVELVQYESDTVQEACVIEGEGLEVQRWLTSVVPRLNNAMIILAGRPKPKLWTDLKTEFAEGFSKREKPVGPASQNEFQLGELSSKEVGEYFVDLAEQNPRIAQADLTTDDCEYIHRVTEGKPLRVAFMSTLIATKGLPPQKLLKGLKPETVDESLIWEMQRLTDDVQVVLPFVAWTRKGIDSRLLQKLLEGVAGKKWGVNKCGRVLNYLRDLPFVKTRPGSRLVFLHDEMYDLMDKYVLGGGDFALDKERVCQIADEYYEDKITKAKKDRERQNLKVELLYYQLLANPMRGFDKYRLLSDEAIIAHKVGFDMSLRDEMLRFFEQRGPQAAQQQIARDSAIRWVKRFLVRGDYKKAREVAKRIWEQDAPPFQRTVDDPYFTAALQIYWNEVLLYRAEGKKAIERVIRLMREAVEPLEAAEPADEYQKRNQPHLRGWAYNILGYAFARLRDYDKAVAEYSMAIRWLKLSGFEGRVANTEKNLAYVYAMLGRFTDAANLSEESLKGFRALEVQWGEAMTLNVYGLIEAEDDNPHRARKRCRDALAIFIDLDDQRGIGLTSITLGRALRKMGNQDTYLFSAEADELLEEAEGRLQIALTVFTKVIDEPVRRVEALAELGRIYRDWAYVCRRRGEAAGPQVEGLEQRAEDNLQEAAKRARELGMLAEETDAYADLAALRFNSRSYDQALEWVAKAESRLPLECGLAPEQPAPLPECPLPQYFLILGKCSLVRGDIAWERGQQTTEKKDAADAYRRAVEWWTIAFGYFELYSPKATTLSLTERQIYRKLMSLWPAQLKALQQHCYHAEEIYELGDTTLHDVFPELIEATTLLRGEDDHEDE